MTLEVQTLLRSWNSAFKSGDREQYSVARAVLRRGIKAAKVAHKKKVEDHLTNTNPRLVWQGLQSFTNYKGSTPITTTSDASLAEEWNNFFSHFEAKSPHSAAWPLQTSSHTTLTSRNTKWCWRLWTPGNPPDRMEYSEKYLVHVLTS